MSSDAPYERLIEGFSPAGVVVKALTSQPNAAALFDALDRHAIRGRKLWRMYEACGKRLDRFLLELRELDAGAHRGPV